MWQEPIYKNIDSLKPIEKLVIEASSAVSDPLRVTSDDQGINEALAATGGIGAGAALGFAPLTPLLLFLQFGTIGNKQYTIGEVARQMYRSGYDFRHFMASSIAVMVTEIIIRLGNVIESLSEGKTLTEATPLDSSLKLRRQLLLAHGVATLINAGKVSVTQNPLALNWPQVLAFIHYVMPELAFLLYGQEAIRSQLVEGEILRDYHAINSEIDTFLRSQDNFFLVI
ncbi:hypothetical protein [Candidatus Oscillochloris fontis]|uniref:hypothetical protein n=1 Tax=Candidatus Oscillochloris fontis TaxID=2496868 RepID=UPI00101C93FD|nr:hypothetical protein [Candidatus Oscillochloris fontis]